MRFSKRIKLNILLAGVIMVIPVVLPAQNSGEELLYFRVTIDEPETLLVKSTEDGSVSVENPRDPKETAIYSAYDIREFEPAFPGSSLADLKRVYRIATVDVNLLSTLWQLYPEKYSKIDQYYPNETAFYPNDYGTTSPVENLGPNFPLTDLDLINAPGAWGITTGSKKVILGISDSKVDSTNIDLQGQVSNYVEYVDRRRGVSCAHGTNVAGIAAAKMNNAFGRPGICPGCDLVATSYGSFKHIEELVAAGARVINTSWAKCSMGKYHEEIEQRINELYDQGILIVAGAGNSKNCNRDGFAPDDYAYPASYEKVISVTGVFSRFDRLEDSVFVDKDGYRTSVRTKDRHSKYHALTKSGKVIPKFVSLNMQFNDAIDICAPAQSYLLGNQDCELNDLFGGATSSTAPYITGVIGLMLSVNYCLDSYEVESILKLTSADIERLPGNERYIGQLGAGRVDAYKAVRTARDMKELMGTVLVSDRDFYRFDFRLRNSPYNIVLQNQVFRDSSSVDFNARNSIILQPGTRLAPDTNGRVRLAISPDTYVGECEPEPLKEYVGLIEEKERIEKEEKAKIKPSFETEYRKSIKAIEIRTLGNNSMNGKSYSVKVLSSRNKLLKQERFTYPDNGLIAFEFNEEAFVRVVITIGKNKESYSLKRGR